MMGKATVIITGPQTRQRAAHYVAKAPAGTRITFALSKRTPPQNDFMWALLTELATQLPWHGVRLSPEDYKDLLTAGLKGSRVVPGVEGGFVVLGQRTKDMTKDEMAELIEAIYQFGAVRGVQFNEVAA
jgi:hypothetical protein